MRKNTTGGESYLTAQSLLTLKLCESRVTTISLSFKGRSLVEKRDYLVHPLEVFGLNPLIYQ